jgi:hypothetical protein
MTSSDILPINKKQQGRIVHAREKFMKNWMNLKGKRVSCVIRMVAECKEMLCLNWQLGSLNFPIQNLLSLLRLTKYESTFLSNVPQFSRQFSFFFLEGLHASRISPYSKRNMQMKMNVEHWWNGTDREKLEYLEENFAQRHFIINLIWTVLGLHPCLSVERLLTNCLTYL